MKLAQTLSPENSDRILYMTMHDGKPLVVYENDQLRWLSFDNVVQTAIYLEPPYRSALPHSYIMLLPLLYDKVPNKVLELGAGGLSAQRYLVSAYPQVDMLSIEYNQTMIDICQHYFPAFAQLKVKQADAFAYVDELQSGDERFDWLMVDIFYGAESPIHNDAMAFTTKLAKLVADQGWLIINVLTKDQAKLNELNVILKQLKLGKVYLYAVPEMQNHIFLLVKNKQFCFPSEIEQHNLA